MIHRRATWSPAARAALLLVALAAAAALVAGCSSAAETTTTVPAAGASTAVSPTPATGAPGASGSTVPVTESPEETIARTTSYEDLKAGFKAALAGGRLEEAYLFAMRYRDLAPSDDEGYIWAIQALMAMSKDNYDKMGALVQRALTSVEDQDRLAQGVKAAEPDRAAAWLVPSGTGEAAGVNTNGNTCGNLANGGLIAFMGEWAYFSNPAGGGHLYKVKPKGPSDLQKIAGDSAMCINVVGDTIYYVNADEGGKLYSIGTNGQDRTMIDHGPCEFVTVEGGWIYFSWLADDQSGLYKIRPDGSERTELVHAPTLFPYVYGGWVYYVDKWVDTSPGSGSSGPTRDALGLWRVPVDGGQAQRLADDGVSSYDIMDGRLYYLMDVESGRAVFSAELDGSGATQVYTLAGKVGLVDAHDGLLFMPIVPADTKKAQLIVYDPAAQKVVRQLFDGEVTGLACSDGWVVYSDHRTGKLYRVDLSDWSVAELGR